MRHTSLMHLAGINSETEGSNTMNKLCESNKRTEIDAFGYTPVTGADCFKKQIVTLPRSHGFQAPLNHNWKLHPWWRVLAFQQTALWQCYDIIPWHACVLKKHFWSLRLLLKMISKLLEKYLWRGGQFYACRCLLKIFIHRAPWMYEIFRHLNAKRGDKKSSD